jgi:hypothetical protein
VVLGLTTGLTLVAGGSGLQGQRKEPEGDVWGSPCGGPETKAERRHHRDFLAADPDDEPGGTLAHCTTSWSRSQGAVVRGGP